MATTHGNPIPTYPDSKGPPDLHVIPPPRSMTYADAIDEIVADFAISRCLEDCDENAWFKALESDVRRIHDLADTFCDDLSHITGVRFRRSSWMKLERVTRGLVVDDFRLVRTGSTIRTMSDRLKHEAREYLSGLPSRIEAKFKDGSGTPRFVPASPVLPGAEGRVFFHFPTRDRLGVQMVVLEETRLWPPDRFPGTLPYSTFSVITRATHETQLLWHTAVMDGKLVGSSRSDDPALVLLAGESGMCPIAVDWWTPDDRGMPGTLAVLRSLARRPGFRFSCLAMLLALLLLAWFLVPAGLTAAAGGMFYAGLVGVAATCLWSVACRGRCSSPLFPWRLVPATHAEI